MAATGDGDVHTTDIGTLRDEGATNPFPGADDTVKGPDGGNADAEGAVGERAGLSGLLDHADPGGDGDIGSLREDLGGD